MKKMFRSAAVIAVIALIAANAHAGVLGISIGVRETGTTQPIGGNGGGIRRHRVYRQRCSDPDV